jgi:spore germination protein KB
MPGFGTVIVMVNADRDTWLVPLIGTVIGMIPILILVYVMNYQPDKNILDKNKLLFGKILGNIINLIISVGILMLLAIVIWAVSFSAQYQYLTEVPFRYISIVFVLPVIYACTKGLETISRVAEILFFVALIIFVITNIGLFQHTKLDYFKPMFKEGFSPIIRESFRFLSYSFIPLITILIIPKNNIKNKEKGSKFLIGGFAIGSIFMAWVFFSLIGVLTISLSTVYRYPAYYVQRKIEVADFFQGVENFLSLHWYFNIFILMALCLYFLTIYITSTFKLVKQKYITLSIFLITVIAIIISENIFLNAPYSVIVMKNQYPFIIAIPLFAILVLISIMVFIKQRKSASN